MESIVGGVNFIFFGISEPVRDFNAQVRFLYEIGFLGLKVEACVVDRLRLLHRDFFVFTAGDEPFDILLKDEFENARFIIHPIFREYLDINVEKGSLIIDFDWGYLQHQEAHVVAAS